MDSSLATLVAGNPDPLWLRLSRWTVIYAVLLFAGLNRWDGGSAATARYVVFGLWATAGISIVFHSRRGISIAWEQLARPGGDAELNRAISQQKRAEWDVTRMRGRRDYAWRSGLRWSVPLTAVVYSLLIVLPSVWSTRLGSLPRSASLLLLLLTAIAGIRAVLAWRSWETIVAAWDKEPIAAPPT